jgi:2-dehydropantoate 2-reductase
MAQTRSGSKEPIGILGAGALGTLLATSFGKARPVRVVSRDPGRARAVARGSPNIAAVERVRDLQGVALLFVCVKAYDTYAAAAELGRAGPWTAAICSLQNGLGNMESLENALPGVPLVAGATWLGAYLDAEGSLHASTAGGTQVASWAGTESRWAEAVAEALSSAGLAAEAAPDAQRVLWTKLVLNAAINPLPAIANRPNGVLLEQPSLMRVAESVAREAARVAVRVGALSADFDPIPLLHRLAENTRENRGSMTEDLDRGRRTEADAILGSVVRAARDVGEPVPVLDGVYALIQDAEASRQAKVKRET